MVCLIGILGWNVVQAQPVKNPLNWQALPPIPDAQGLAGMFAESLDGVLIAAGGANFPDAPPWENGTKVYHDRIWALESPEGEWKEVGKLPLPMAYGVTAVSPDGLLLMGGTDGERHLQEIYRLRWDGEQATVTVTSALLPYPLAYLSGVQWEKEFFIYGGSSSPDDTKARNQCWAMNVDDPYCLWFQVTEPPGPGRILSTLGLIKDRLFIFGGAALEAGEDSKPVRRYLKDTLSFQANEGWVHRAEMPWPATATPGPAMPVGQGHLLLLGGDDASLLSHDLATHPGFPGHLLAYHWLTDSWSEWGTARVSRVTAPLVAWQGRHVLISGEMRPGVRSPEVWSVTVDEPRPSFRVADYGVMGIYLALVVGVGLLFSRRQGTTEDFFLAGRRIPWWASGLSIVGTQLSAITFMAVPAKAYATDWVFMIGTMTITLIAPFIAWIYVPKFREFPITTAYEFLERRFNVGVRSVASAAFAIFQIGRMGIILLLPALALSTVTGIHVMTCILLMGLLATLYTVLGGIEAVIWTDVLQVIVLLAGAVLCFVMILGNIDGGWGTFIRVGSEHAKFHTFNLSPSLTTASIWVVVIGQALNNLMPYTGDQAVIQRYLATPDVRQARRAVWLNGLMTTPITLLFFSLGTALFVFYHEHPEKLSPLTTVDGVLPWFIASELPPGLAGLLLAAIFAAAMSSLDSSMNSVATAITTDFLRRWMPSKPEGYFMKWARGLTLGLGLFATLAAVFLAQSGQTSLFDNFLKLMGLLGGGITSFFLLGVFSKRANPAGVLIGAACSTGLLAWVQATELIHFLMYAAVGVGGGVALGYFFSLLLTEEEEEGKERTASDLAE